MDEILSEPYDLAKVKPCVEAKLFGIGVESFTAGSAEFALSYAAINRDKCLPLLDNGHYHPTEVVSDKVPALLCFFDELALHVTRGIRWDSDHVVLLDDETMEIAKEVVRCDALDRVYLSLDYFDASINRVSAWVTGFRSLQKALLSALLMPNEELKALQNENNFTKIMYLNEKFKMMPVCDVWLEYLERQGLSDDWYSEIEDFEKEVISKRM
jgi:L-rhamnose isomerase